MFFETRDLIATVLQEATSENDVLLDVAATLATTELESPR